MIKLALFEPLVLNNGVTIKNRFVKPAMSEVMGDQQHRPTSKLIRLYHQWAQGGTGLLITGNVMVDSRALGEAGNVVIENEKDLALLKRWAKAGSSNGTQIWVQLNHPGKQSPKTMSRQPVAPSAIPLTGPNAFGFNPPRALSIDEIHEIVTHFAVAASIVKKAGFGGVEIHAAHGYLLNQFLSPHDNQRFDEYGGSLENRMRILVEIYQQVRARVGDEFPVAVKINSSDFSEDGFNEADSLEVIQKLAELGVDLIEISGGNYENPTMQSTNTGAFFIKYAEKVKAAVDIPIILTGGFRSVRGMEAAVADHKTEMVGLARAIALVPDLPNQARSGQFSSIDLDWLSTGVKVIDKRMSSYIGLSYYQLQMNRIAQGKPTRRTTNAWIPLGFALRTQGPSIFTPNRA